MGEAGALVAGPDADPRRSLDGSPEGHQRGAVADQVGMRLAGSAARVRKLETVYNRHRRWSGDGTWREVLSGLRVDCDLLDGGEWVLGVDGTVVRAHHHAAGARHEPPKDIPAEVLAPTVLEVAVTPVKSTGGSIE